MTIEELVEAAGAGELHAQFALFLMYANGWGVQQNDTAAAEYLSKVLLSGHPFAQYCAGSYFAERPTEGQGLRTAFQWYERSALQGYAPAEHMVCSCYQHGLGVEVDPAKAFEWAAKAAASGFVPAQRSLAAMFAEGIGTAKDLASSFRWYLEAAERGDADSAFHTAALLELGEGTVQDWIAALQWYERAAAGGSWNAYHRLATVYREGLLGVAADPAKAAAYDRFADSLSERLSK